MTEHRARKRRHGVGLVAAGAMVLATAPAGVATAQVDEPRDIGSVCPGGYDSSFDDVDGDETHAETILCAADWGIAAGYPDDTFRSNLAVEREQMASFVVRWVESAIDDELPEGDEDFPDVDPDDHHRESIAKLTTAQIALGYEDGNFYPDQVVQRDQTASFIARALSYIDDFEADNASQPPVPDGDHFTDVDEGNQHYLAVNALAEQGIVTGYDGTDQYGPHDGVTRAQMTAFIMRGYGFAAEHITVEPTVDIAYPTSDDDVTLEPGAELDVIFTTATECTYGIDAAPTGTDDADAWHILGEGVTTDGEQVVGVELPDDVEPGDWDLRITCYTEHDAHTATEVEAFEVVSAQEG